jgi:hypothetical protein
MNPTGRNILAGIYVEPKLIGCSACKASQKLFFHAKIQMYVLSISESIILTGTGPQATGTVLPNRPSSFLASSWARAMGMVRSLRTGLPRRPT